MWTYTGDPSVSHRDAIRFLIGDTDSTDQLLQDEEIDWLHENAGNSIYQGAHDACHALAAKFTRLATSKSVGDLSISYADRARAFLDLSEQIMQLAARRDIPTPWASPKNMTTAAKRSELGEQGQEFWTGIHDNKRL